ncbi:MAG: hypothetical protein AB7W28_09335 [Armatimonadota bacterium]
MAAGTLPGAGLCVVLALSWSTALLLREGLTLSKVLGIILVVAGVALLKLAK